MCKFSNIIFLLSFLILTNTYKINAQYKRCGTPDPPYTVKANSLYSVQMSNVKMVPVILHVIYNSDGAGNISDSKLIAQVDTLNAAYNRMGSSYSFYLAAITRTQSNQWFNITRGSQAETDMTNALAIDPKHIFNVYVLNADPDLGWVINFPWDVPEDSRQNGVIIHYGSVPGGNIINYNSGYTLVHEGGHYLGLYHTFQNGCTSPGDEVDDTPYEAYPTSGCPDPNPDTCPQDGLDPIHNYMDYSNDPCMNQFTIDQISRILSIMGQYRPNLGGITLTILSGTTLTIYSNTKIEFPLNFSFQVFGTLNATNVIFDRIGSSGNWGGIKFNNGSSGSLTYSTIKNANRGIECNGVMPTINGCYIRDNVNGIWLNNVGSPATQILNNHIWNNDCFGIACFYSSPKIDVNAFDNNPYCIWCLGSTPWIYDNYFLNSSYGIYLTSNSPANIRTYNGNYANAMVGFNTAIYADAQCNAIIHNNNIDLFYTSNYGIRANGNTYVSASSNWWGSGVLDPNKFYATNGAQISYLPVSGVNPNHYYPPQLSASFKNDEIKTEENKITTDDSFLTGNLLNALQLLIDERYNEAIAVYVQEFRKGGDLFRKKYIVSQLAECYRAENSTPSENGFINFLNNEVRPNLTRNDELFALTLQLENLFLIKNKKYEDAIDNYISLKTNFENNEFIHKDALFNLGYIYCELLDDNNQGRKYFQELVDNYPDDELVKIINLIVDNTGGTSLKKNSAKNINIQVPDKFELLGNYPNPFNPSTTISYTLPYQSSVELVIYDIIGRIVKSFNVSSQSAGYQSIVWDGRNGIGNSVASGIYLYKLSTGNFTQTKK